MGKKKTGQSQIKKKLIKDLPCEMTEDERRMKGSELAVAVSDKQTLEVEKKNFADAWKERAKEVDTKIGTLAYQVRSGREIRAVECEEAPRYSDRMMDIVRLDLGEVVYSRPMEAGELQTMLDSLIDEQQEQAEDPNPRAH